MIGKQVYFCDLKDDCVKVGVIYSTTVNQAGYKVYNILYEGKRQSVDESLIFTNEDVALKSLETILPIKHKMEKIQKETEKQLDDLRELIVGKPKYKELSDEIYK